MRRPARLDSSTTSSLDDVTACASAIGGLCPRCVPAVEYPAVLGGVLVLALATAAESQTMYTAAGQQPPTYSTNPAFGVTIRASDISEVREALARLESLAKGTGEILVLLTLQ